MTVKFICDGCGKTEETLKPSMKTLNESGPNEVFYRLPNKWVYSTLIHENILCPECWIIEVNSIIQHKTLSIIDGNHKWTKNIIDEKHKP